MYLVVLKGLCNVNNYGLLSIILLILDLLSIASLVVLHLNIYFYKFIF
jgi:hypothetical protein